MLFNLYSMSLMTCIKVLDFFHVQTALLFGMLWKIVFFITCLNSFSLADVAPFERQRTDKLTVVSFDGTATLTVSLERIDRDKILRIDKGKDKPPEAWFGKRQLPADILWNRTTMIRSFELTCLLYTSPSPRDKRQSRMPSSA